MKIIGFCDFEGNSINNQIETAQILNINHILLRQVEDKLINELDANDFNEINNELKKGKKTIYAIDPLIMPYDLYSNDGQFQALEAYENALQAAVKLKVERVFFRLPKIKDIIHEFDVLETQMIPILELAKKHNKILMIVQGEEKVNVLTYVLKKFNRKDLTLMFDPKQITKNNESPITAYRLLKDFFNVVVASDMDSKKNPELLGYGKVRIFDLFKRMSRDKYSGDVIFDDSFKEFLMPKEEKKVPLFKKLFGRNDKKILDNYLHGYSSRIFPNETDHIADIFDIYESQIKALKIIFSLRD